MSQYDLRTSTIPLVDGITAEQRREAERVVYSALDQEMPDAEARANARQIVQLLIDIKWRPTT